MLSDPSEPAASVGDVVHHARFGRGLVVEVRHRAHRVLLEIAFPDGVRTLDAAHPLLERHSAQDAAGADAREIAWRWTPSLQDIHGAVRAGDAHPRDLVQLRVQAETLALVRGFERLLALESANGLIRYRHQVDACTRVLRDMEGRALLADEVGLGKTVEAGLILSEYVLRGMVRRVLVLAPVSLQLQWQQELREKFGLQFVVRARDAEWSADALVISSLETARSARHRERIHRERFDMVIVDEAHRLKNSATVGWRFLNKLASPYLLLLTATPIQNDLRELYNLVTLVRPGLLGTPTAFRRTYTMRGDARSPRNADALGDRLRTVMVRTTRAAAGIKTPPRRVETVQLALAPAERAVYDAVSRFVRTLHRATAQGARAGFAFTLLVLQKEIGSSTRAAAHTLRRMREHPRYADVREEIDGLLRLADDVQVSRKIDTLVSLIAAARDSAIVFTQFRATAREVADALAATGRPVWLFHGSLTRDEKEQAIESFREQGGVLVSTEAGGEGRNLQFCRTVVNYDLPWNPMRLEQRIGRVFRLGQTREVRVYNFAARDTLEAYVLELLERKIRMFELVIGEMEMILGTQRDEHSFDEVIFRLWVDARTDADLRGRFDRWGDELSLARKTYESLHELDRLLLDRD